MSRTLEILHEMLARELAAKTLYDDLSLRVRGTEFEHLQAAFAGMAREEAQHVERVRALLGKLEKR